ncbi:hypothetical protein Bca52824_013190 [Brassica carinata]|uniref:Uncharacterized protein n=1 Tax=Brassica carinata TaxID=52824 RepID=A0A8X8B3N1_BRACI|nr:hypothetical protein Bca52824_013190 [Brassica carinata]
MGLSTRVKILGHPRRSIQTTNLSSCIAYLPSLHFFEEPSPAQVILLRRETGARYRNPEKSSTVVWRRRQRRLTGSDPDPQEKLLATAGLGSSGGSRRLLDVQRPTAERQLDSDPRRRSGEQDQRACSRRVQSVRSVYGREGEAVRVYAKGLRQLHRQIESLQIPFFLLQGDAKETIPDF